MPSWTQQSIAERVLATDVTAIVVLDEHGELVYANEMASHMLGLHLPALGSSDAAPPEQITNPDSAEHLQQLPEEFASFRWIACTDTPLRDVRLALELPHLGPRLFSINASPLPSQATEPNCVVLSIHDFTEQYRYYEEALQKSEERLKLATEAAGIGIWERDLLNDTFHWDERMCAIYGCRPDQLPNDYPQWRQMVLEEDIPDIERAFRQAFENRSRFETEFRIRSYNGRTRYLRGFGQYIYDKDGQAVKLVGVNEDITARKNVERELALSKDRLEEAQRIARLGHWIAATDKRILGIDLWCSKVLFEIFGLDPHESNPTVKSYLKAVHPGDRRAVLATLSRLNKGGILRLEHRIIPSSGGTKWIRVIARTEDNRTDNGHRLLGTVQDITEQKELQHELEYRASHDPLTDLYNRAKLQQQLRAAKSTYERHGTVFAIILADIDHFKAVNDQWGHSVGDAVLWEIGRRISAQIRESDFLGRWGGEEFLILVNQTDEDGAAQLAERIRHSISHAEIQGIGTITSSFGLAAIEPGVSLESMEDRADQALYAAKQRGRNQVIRYSKVLNG